MYISHRGGKMRLVVIPEREQKNCMDRLQNPTKNREMIEFFVPHLTS